MKPTDEKLQRAWWLWVPLGAMVAQLAVEIVLPRRILVVMHGENGSHELLEFFVIFLAFLVALRVVWAAHRAGRPWLMAWAGLAALCSFYVAGEEISWGQQFLHWATPEYWAAINDQHETNLHNTSSWLDQKPKLLLQIGVYVGGLIIPLLLRYKPKFLPKRFTVIYPPAITAVTALFALGIMIEHKLAQVYASLIFFTRANEVQELYLYYFVLIYLVILRGRILQDQR